MTKAQLRRRFRAAKCTAILAAAMGPMLLHADLATAVTASWLSAASGLWTDPTRWSSNPAYPNGVQDNARIEAVGGVYTITLNSNISLGSCVLNSSSCTLALTGGSFSSASGIDVESGTLFLNGGTISSSTFSGVGGSVSLRNGNLNAITLRREASIFNNNGPADPGLIFSGGLTLDGGIVHASTFNGGPGARVFFTGNQTLGGNGTVVFDGDRNSDWYAIGTLTVGSGVLVRGSAQLNYSSGNLINQGTIRA
jgi:hypothetical protein